MKTLTYRERYGPRSLDGIRETFNDATGGWKANGAPDLLVLKNFSLGGYELYKEQHPSQSENLIPCKITLCPARRKPPVDEQWFFPDLMMDIVPATESCVLTGYIDKTAMELSDADEFPICIPGTAQYLTTGFDLTRTSAYDVTIELG